ncbi:hypothetical protein M0R72_07110 [Candidatus Pacearchaeota archaeon]|nr:hypothetical protein [Candidatus Pacearchaeota archaeon]
MRFSIPPLAGTSAANAFSCTSGPRLSAEQRGCTMCGDSFRFCLSCQQITRWHKHQAIHHSLCKRCGHPSIYAVKMPLSAGKIAEREDELRFMMGYTGPIHV